MKHTERGQTLVKNLRNTKQAVAVKLFARIYHTHEDDWHPTVKVLTIRKKPKEET